MAEVLRIPHKKDIILVALQPTMTTKPFDIANENEFIWVLHYEIKPANPNSGFQSSYYKADPFYNANVNTLDPPNVPGMILQGHTVYRLFTIRQRVSSTLKKGIVICAVDSSQQGNYWILRSDKATMDVAFSSTFGLQSRPYYDMDFSPDASAPGAIIVGPDINCARIYWDSTTWNSWIGNADDPLPNVAWTVANFLDSLWLGRFNYDPDLIKYSNVGDITSTGAFANELVVARGRYGNIIKLKKMPILTASGRLEYLVIYKQEAVFVLTGFPSSGASELKLVAEGVGIPDLSMNQCVANTPYGQVFVGGAEGDLKLYLLSQSGEVMALPVDFSFKEVKALTYDSRRKSVFLLGRYYSGEMDIYGIFQLDFSNLQQGIKMVAPHTVGPQMNALIFVGDVFDSSVYNNTLWCNNDDELAFKGYNIFSGGTVPTETEDTFFRSYGYGGFIKGFAFPYDVIFKGIKVISNGKTVNGKTMIVGCAVIEGIDTSGAIPTNKYSDEKYVYVRNIIDSEHTVYMPVRLRGKRFYVSISFEDDIRPDYIEQIQFIFEPRGGRR